MNQNETTSGPQIVALIRDLFFSVKVGNELKAHGYTPVIVKTVDQFAGVLAERQPALALIDIGAHGDWERIRSLVTDPATADVPIIAFGPHKDVDGLRAAKEAGVSRVVSNGQLHASLPELVKRYARE